MEKKESIVLTDDRVEELEFQLLTLVKEVSEKGLTLDEVLFAFSRSTYRLAKMLVPDMPPEGRSYYLTVTGVSGCGCLLEVEMSDHPQPEGYVHSCSDHENPN
jgi:hypothetical protein